MKKNLYLLVGEDEYERELYIQKTKEKFGNLEKGINYIKLDKENIRMLEDEILTYPFGYDRKLIIVDLNENKKEASEEKETNNGSKARTKKNEEYITENVEEAIRNIDEGTYLIFYAKALEKTNKLRNIIEQNGEVISFDKLKPMQLVTWVANMCKEKDILMTGSDANYFIEMCGNDKQNLFNELTKLIDYTGSGNKIEKSTIDKLCVKTSDSIVFTLTDYMGNKDAKKALETLEELLENKEPIQKIVIVIAKHFKSVLLTKVVLSQKKDVAKELDMKPYPVSKYSMQSRKYSLEELVKIYLELAKLDIDAKLGKIDLKIGLQKIICSV